jgi:hypothetical protein
MAEDPNGSAEIADDDLSIMRQQIAMLEEKLNETRAAIGLMEIELPKAAPSHD